MFSRKKQPPLTREQSMQCVPVRNQLVEEKRSDSGEVTLYLPRRDVWWVNAIARIFYVPKKGRGVMLDELGTNVWDMIDGQATVKQVIERFAERYRLSKREAELSIVAHLKNLAKRGLIGIAVVNGPDAKGRKKQKQPQGTRNR
jgi:hypothetical protein